jgi:hypothetical protein
MEKETEMSQNIKWTKPVCQLDADNTYIGQINAELDIYARDGSYLIPAGCIDTLPPKISAGYVARWNGEGWDVIEDYRGKVVYRKADGVAVIIDKVGSLSDELTVIAPANEYCEWDGEKWIENQAKKAAAAEEKLNNAKRLLIKRINKESQEFIDNQSGAADLPDYEVQSWSLQSKEARAWAEDKNAETPILDKIADVRGISPIKLKEKVFEKQESYNAMLAAVIGQRQSLQNRIESAQTIEDLEVIEIKFEME